MRRSRWLWLTICLLILPAGSAHASRPLRGLQRLFKDWGLFQGLQVSGSNTMTLQGNSIQGSEAAYQGQRWDTGNFVRRSSLHVEGPIWRNFGLQADISSSGWGPTYTRYVLGWTNKNTALYYGDLNINLRGNEFAGFNKTLKGWQLDQRLPLKGMLRTFYSEEKGLTRRQTIPGNNTSGPYFLTYTPIIDGSEVVRVDEQRMRFGEDYRLDYETGQLWFEPVDRPPRIIPSTSVISVSYQSAGWRSTPGKLYGARVQMPLIDKKLDLGLTLLRQDRSGGSSSRDTVGYQEDIYQGSGTTGPFDVNYRPIIANGSDVVYQGQQQVIEQPLAVLVDNVEQVEGVDYDSYRQIGRIIFRRAVPPTALVVIRYYYDIGADVRPGDSQVYGLDLRYRINNDLGLTADWAASSGGASASSGSALRTSLQYSAPKLSATLELRDVEPDFSYIETVGFQRNEKGLNFAAQWELSDYISVYERYSDLASGQGLLFGYSGYSGYSGGYGSYGDYGGYNPYGVSTAQATQPASLDVSTMRNDLGVDVRYPSWPTLNYSHQTMANRGGTRGSSTQDTDQISLNYTPSGKPYQMSLRYNNSTQSYGGLSGSDESNPLYSARGSDTSQLTTSLTYTPTDTLSLSANIGRNRSHATDSDVTGTSDMLQLSARWMASSNFSLNLSHTMSESLGSVSSGFYGGGYGGGGYGGGGMYSYQYGGYPWNPGGGGTGDTDGSQEPTLNRYEDSNTRIDLSYRPTSRVTLSLSGQQRDYTSGGSVGYLADSNQTSYNLSVGWQPTSEMSVTTLLGSDRMKFLEEGRGAVINDMIALSINYRPEGAPWGLNVNLNRQKGSSPTYIGFGDQQISRIVPTNLFDISGQLSYDMGEGFSIYGRLGRSKFESGYANFNKDTGELGVRYRMSDLADLSFGYRYIRNISTEPDLPLPGYIGASQQGQNYIAQTLMLGVTSNFHSGLGQTGASAPGYSGYGAFDYGGGYGSYGGYGLAGRNFGGYRTGSAGQYGTGLSGFDSTYGSNGSSRYGTTPYGTGTYGTNRQFGGAGGIGDFSSGYTGPQGSSAYYYGSAGGRQGYETGLGQFTGGGYEGEPGQQPQWTEEGGFQAPGAQEGGPQPGATSPFPTLQEPELPEAPTWPADDSEWWQEDV